MTVGLSTDKSSTGVGFYWVGNLRPASAPQPRNITGLSSPHLLTASLPAKQPILKISSAWMFAAAGAFPLAQASRMGGGRLLAKPRRCFCIPGAEACAALSQPACVYFTQTISRLSLPVRLLHVALVCLEPAIAVGNPSCRESACSSSSPSPDGDSSYALCEVPGEGERRRAGSPLPSGLMLLTAAVLSPGPVFLSRQLGFHVGP